MKIYKEDFDWAVSENLISSGQAEILWKALSLRDSKRPKFNGVNIAYYFGALIVISAMTLFLGLGWESFGGSGICVIAISYAACFLLLARRLWYVQHQRVPGGLLATMAVCMTPLAIYGFQRATGLWPQADPGTYQGFYAWVKGGWFAMELGTIVAGLVALRFFRFPFLVAPIAFTLWFMSMDITPLLFGTIDNDWHNRVLVSFWFGLAMLVVAYWVDLRTSRGFEDFAFWLYLFGLIAFWGSLPLMEESDEMGKFIYFLINLMLIALSALLKRRVMIIFGGMGVFGYISYLSYNVFGNSLLFPFALTAIGLGVIFLGVFYQRRGEAIENGVIRLVPEFLRRLLPTER